MLGSSVAVDLRGFLPSAVHFGLLCTHRYLRRGGRRRGDHYQGLAFSHGDGRWATLMSHFLAVALSIALLTHGMVAGAVRRLLVACGSLAH